MQKSFLLFLLFLGLCFSQEHKNGPNAGVVSTKASVRVEASQRNNDPLQILNNYQPRVTAAILHYLANLQTNSLQNAITIQAQINSLALGRRPLIPNIRFPYPTFTRVKRATTSDNNLKPTEDTPSPTGSTHGVPANNIPPIPGINRRFTPFGLKPGADPGSVPPNPPHRWLLANEDEKNNDDSQPMNGQPTLIHYRRPLPAEQGGPFVGPSQAPPPGFPSSQSSLHGQPPMFPPGQPQQGLPTFPQGRPSPRFPVGQRLQGQSPSLFDGQSPQGQPPRYSRGQPRREQLSRFPPQFTSVQRSQAPRFPPGQPQQGQPPQLQTGQPSQGQPPRFLPQQPQQGQPPRFQPGQSQHGEPQQGKPPRFQQRQPPTRFQQGQPPRFPPGQPPRRQPTQGQLPSFPSRQPPQRGQLPRFPQGQPPTRFQQGQPPWFPQGQPPTRFQQGQPPRFPSRQPPQRGQLPPFPSRQPPRYSPPQGQLSPFPSQQGQPPRFPPQQGQYPQYPGRQPSLNRQPPLYPTQYPPRRGQPPMFPPGYSGRNPIFNQTRPFEWFGNPYDNRPYDPNRYEGDWFDQFDTQRYPPVNSQDMPSPTRPSYPNGGYQYPYNNRPQRYPYRNKYDVRYPYGYPTSQGYDQGGTSFNPDKYLYYPNFQDSYFKDRYGNQPTNMPPYGMYGSAGYQDGPSPFTYQAGNRNRSPFSSQRVFRDGTDPGTYPDTDSSNHPVPIATVDGEEDAEVESDISITNRVASGPDTDLNLIPTARRGPALSAQSNLNPLAVLRSFVSGETFLDSGYLVQNMYTYGDYGLAKEHFRALPNVNVTLLKTGRFSGFIGKIQNYRVTLCRECGLGQMYPVIEIVGMGNVYPGVVKRLLYTPGYYPAEAPLAATTTPDNRSDQPAV